MQSSGSRQRHHHEHEQGSTTPELDRISQQREKLETRHAQGLARLMGARADLRGVHALADLVDDAVRWTA
jgi:hypothetical protein